MGELTNWQEIAVLFLIASVTGVLVGSVVNKLIKSHPVLVVQISMLVTLFLYPAINAYLFVLMNPDYNSILSGKMDYLSYCSAMFFAPLPSCVLVTVVFYLFRTKSKARIASQPTPQSIKSAVLKRAALVLSVVMGGLWLLTMVGKILYVDNQDRLIVLLLFTVYGLLASFVAWITFWISKFLG